MIEYNSKYLELGLSYSSMLRELIHSPNAIRNKEHEYLSPFNNKGQKGYFIYLTNRTFERYSYLYSSLESIEVFNDCILPMGYTNIWLCKTLEYIDSGNFIVLEEIPVLENCNSYEFVVFKDPTKTNYKANDILGGFSTIEEAREFSLLLKQKYNLSTLITKKEESITWH